MKTNVLYLTAEMAKDSSLNMGDKMLLARFINLCTLPKSNGVAYYTRDRAFKEFGIKEKALLIHLNHLKSENFIQTKTKLINNKTTRTVTLTQKVYDLLQTAKSDSSRTPQKAPLPQNSTAVEHSQKGVSSTHTNIHIQHTYIDIANLPQSIEQVIPYFSDFVNRHISDHPNLIHLDVNLESENFFLYYQPNGWKDKNNKPVKSVKGRVASWCSNWLKANSAPGVRFSATKQPNVLSQSNINERAKTIANMLTREDLQKKFENAVDVEAESVLI